MMSGPLCAGRKLKFLVQVSSEESTVAPRPEDQAALGSAGPGRGAAIGAARCVSHNPCAALLVVLRHGPCACCQASVAHSRHRVLPVPVGDSSSAFLPSTTASSTRWM